MRIRMIKAALQKHQVDTMKPLDEAAEQSILRQLVKQRTDAAEMFRKGGPSRAGGQRRSRARVIQGYMPAEATEVEIAQAVDGGARRDRSYFGQQMGVVMKAAQAKLAASARMEKRSARKSGRGCNDAHRFLRGTNHSSRRHADVGVHAACLVHRADHDHRPRRGQCVPRPARGPDDCRHLSWQPSSAWRCCARSRGRFSKRTSRVRRGRIGESVAAGAIFTVPAFVIAKVWPSFSPADAYWKSTVLMTPAACWVCCSVRWCGACWWKIRSCHFRNRWRERNSQSGQHGAQGAKYLFWNMGFGGLVYMLSALGLFATDRDFGVAVANLAGASCGSSTSGGRRWEWAASASGRDRRSVRLLWRGIHHRTGARVDQLLRQRAGLGLMIPLLIIFSGRNCRPCFRQERRATPVVRSGGTACGGSSCGRSPWVACSSGRSTRCFRMRKR